MARDRKILQRLEDFLCHTAWGRGVYTKSFQVPAARPSQIRAAAKKLFDRLTADKKRLQHGA